MRKIGVVFVSLLLALAMVPGSANAGGPPATFTTINFDADGGDHCKNGPSGATTVVNCNIYDGKQYVWLNGGPSNAALADGTYFFAVLVPGGQPDPNDGGAKNLSDTTLAPLTTGSASGDARARRTFTVSGGTISYAGTHDFDSNMIRLMPYDDTTNEGGVYILGICKLSSPNATVDPRKCKYDAFKVQENEVLTPPLDAPTAFKTAGGSFDRTFTWTLAKAADQTQINQSGTTATVNYTITVTHDGGTDSNFTVSGTIYVVNPNSVPIAISSVTDAISGGGTCIVPTGVASTSIQPGATGFDYTCTGGAWSAGDTGLNTATLTWPAQSIPGFLDLAGGTDNTATATFSFDTPTLKNDCVAVNDSLQGSLGNVCVGDPGIIKYSRTVSGTAGTCTPIDNTASVTPNTTGPTVDSNKVTVTLCVGADLQVTKSANPAFKRTYNWSISKSVDQNQINTALTSGTFNYSVLATQTGLTDSDWVVTGLIQLTNPNDWEDISATTVSDAIDNGGACAVTGGGLNVDVSKGGTPVTLAYTCTYASAPTAPNFTNTATASWNAATAFTPDGTNSGAATGAFTLTGATVTLVNKTITVTDTFGGVTNALGTLTATDAQPYTSHTFAYPRTVTGTAGTCVTVDNTAKITETNQTTPKVTVKLCVGKDLQVTKSANPAFKRTYNWSISKSVDQNQINTALTSGTFNYSVLATQTGLTDSDWVVTGLIQLTNPNDWEDISATTVSDAIDNGGACAVTGGGLNVDVSKGGTPVTLAYTCTYASAPTAPNFTNTATASWNAATAFTPDGTNSGAATGAFTLTGATVTLVNKTITVTDTFGGVTNALGTLTATDAQPYTSHTFAYPRTVAVPASGCLSYDNTAKITETNQTTLKVTVQACKALTGALTMGFWQNKNGQAIIAGANQSALGSFLTGYHPFSDMTNPITAYVTNVIKAASASGSSMNAMLKAQMLATALDVYFSNPSNGNPIKAPSSIGGITIDLTKICHMIDGSGGTATCSGTYEDASVAFGGATSMTVSAMLLYQNAADPSADAGAAWYGQVKATQQLAKDAFDAINNQVAFAP